MLLDLDGTLLDIEVSFFLASTHRVDRKEAVTAPDATGDLKELGRLLGLW
ncbi:MAG: hypothetical protein ACC669_01145 [bacterium]